MSSGFLNIIIGIATATIGVLAFVNEFPDRRYTKHIKSLEFKLIVFVLATITLIWATVQKDSNTETESIKDKLQAKTDQSKRDLANRMLTDQSNAKIVNTFTEALAKYNLKYDSSQKTILKSIRDSSKSTYPDVDICNIKLTRNRNDSLSFELSLCCTKATAYNINIKTLSIAETEDGAFLLVVGNENLFETHRLGVDKFMVAYLSGKFPKVTNFYWLLKGTYRSINNKIFPYENIFVYGIKDKIKGEGFGMPHPNVVEKINQFLKERKIKI